MILLFLEVLENPLKIDGRAVVQRGLEYLWSKH